MQTASAPSRVATSSPLPEIDDLAHQEVPGDRQLEGVRAPLSTIEKIAPLRNPG